MQQTFPPKFECKSKHEMVQCKGIYTQSFYKDDWRWRTPSSSRGMCHWSAALRSQSQQWLRAWWALSMDGGGGGWGWKGRGWGRSHYWPKRTLYFSWKYPWPLAFITNLTFQFISFSGSPGASWPGVWGFLCHLSPFSLLASPAWPLSKPSAPIPHQPQNLCAAVLILLPITLPSIMEISHGLAVHIII